MDFQEGLSADLPAPRDDEPGGLRDDILDELADHLACAYRRELLRGTDAATARQRVLKRFGDPAVLARRLWFDAMKGKIMSQRILTICCILLTVISLSLAFMLWNQAVQARRLAAETTARMAEQMLRAEEIQQQVMQQFQVFSKSVSSAKSSDWIPVSFKLTQEVPDGPPAVGVQARLGRGYQGVDKDESIQRESDAEGMIDFGVVQPGDWEFDLSRPMKDGGNWHLTGKLNALPGTSIQKTIVCPKTDEATARVSLRFDWPPDMADKGLAVVACLKHDGFAYQPPLHWRELHDFDSLGTAGIKYVLCGPGANKVTGIERGSPALWRLDDQAPVGYARASSIPAPGAERADQTYVDLMLKDQAGDSGPGQILAGRYQLQKIAVVRHWKTLNAGNRGERLELVAYASLIGSATEQVILLPQPPDGPLDSLVVAGTFRISNVQDIVAHATYPTLEAKKDQPVVWSIHLPDELTQAVREKLQAEKKNK